MTFTFHLMYTITAATSATMATHNRMMAMTTPATTPGGTSVGGAVNQRKLYIIHVT